MVEYGGTVGWWDMVEYGGMVGWWGGWWRLVGRSVGGRSVGSVVLRQIAFRIVRR